MRVKKRRSDLDHSVFVLRNRECDQEVNQSKCKAEPGSADKQVEDAQFPAVLQTAVCTAPAQKTSKQDKDPLIYLVAGAVLLPVGIFLQSTHDDVLLFAAKKSKSKMDILHSFSPFFTPQDWFDAPCFMICNKTTKSVAQCAKKTEKDLCGIFLTIVIY